MANCYKPNLYTSGPARWSCSSGPLCMYSVSTDNPRTCWFNQKNYSEEILEKYFTALEAQQNAAKSRGRYSDLGTIYCTYR